MKTKTLFSLTLIIMLMLNTLISSGAELVIEPVSEPELTHMPQYIEPVNIQGRYKLTELGSNLTLWTDYVSEKVFKDSSIPTDVASGIQVYMAKKRI